MSGVRVDETKVVSTGQGRDWWVDFRKASHPSRITTLEPGVIGSVVRVECDAPEDARDFARMLVEWAGLPKTAVRVVA